MPTKQNKHKAKAIAAKQRARAKLEKLTPADKVAASAIKTAAELGLKAESLGIKKKAKTHKGRTMLARKEPQLKENTKRSIMIKGNKMS
jgi:hypothetical protein